MPPMNVMIKLCNCLGTSYDYLVGLCNFNRQIAPINNNDAIRNRYRKSIKNNVPYGERLAQCAEEAAELSKAFLKWRRTAVSGNPTSITPEEALNDVVEELADLILCMDTVDLHVKVINPKLQKTVRELKDFKLARWIERLKNDSKTISETAREN